VRVAAVFDVLVVKTVDRPCVPTFIPEFNIKHVIRNFLDPQKTVLAGVIQNFFYQLTLDPGSNSSVS